MKKLILDNRTTTTALKAGQFQSKDEYTNWKNAVETLRLKVSDYAILNMEDVTGEALELTVNEFFTAYRKVLSFFTNKAIGEKVKPQQSDLNSLMALVGTMRKDGENGKQFLPIGSTIFRKSVEDFISDRLTSASHKTAEDIETEKAEKREKKKAERKAKREAEKAEEQKAA